MSTENTSTLVSMPKDFTKRMKEYSKDKDVAFSSMIRAALRMYTNDADTCFVEIAKEHAGTEAADNAGRVLAKFNITQSHFLGHVLKEASKALEQMQRNDDWHDIRCVLKRGSEENQYLKRPARSEVEQSEDYRKFEKELKEGEEPEGKAS